MCSRVSTSVDEFMICLGAVLSVSGGSGSGGCVTDSGLVECCCVMKLISNIDVRSIRSLAVCLNVCMV